MPCSRSELLRLKKHPWLATLPAGYAKLVLFRASFLSFGDARRMLDAKHGSPLVAAINGAFPRSRVRYPTAQVTETHVRYGHLVSICGQHVQLQKRPEMPT